MTEIISALWPVFALLILGYIARRSGFPGDDFWPLAERATYFVLFPVMLVDRLAQADLSGVEPQALVGMVISLVLIGTGASFLMQRFLKLESATFTSFYQGSVRFNTYVGLAVVAALFTGDAVAVSAMVIAVLIPLLNLACVLVFALFGEARLSLGKTLQQIFRNPLILGCLIGLGLNLSGLGLHTTIANVTELLSRMALPLGLLAVGAGLNLARLHEARAAVLWASSIKLLLLPLLVYLLARLCALDPVLTQVITLFAALPTAPAAYVLARQMGGDASFMAALITGQTLLSIITLPFILHFL
jgi:predicted permease